MTFFIENIYVEQTVNLLIKSFITQLVFIQSFKLDIFWKAENREKHTQSLFILLLKLENEENGLTCKNWGFC